MRESVVRVCWAVLIGVLLELILGTCFPLLAQKGRIAFISNREGPFDVYIMDADGANPIRVTDHPEGSGSPAGSLDGSRIAFETPRDGNWEIYVANADGTDPLNLTQHPAPDGLPA